MKLWNYVVIITGLSLFLEFAGIAVGGLQDLFTLIGITLNSTGLSAVAGQNSAFWLAVFGTGGILVIITGAVLIGTLTRTSPENYVVLPIITGTTYLFGTIIFGIVTYSIQTSSWVAAITGLLLIPLGFGFVLSSLDYFRGID